jgi:diguanylate cyclase (GGDEF)-like protein
MKLDIETIFIGYVIANFINAAVIFQLWRQNRTRLDGAVFWLIDYIMQFVAVTLVALRGLIPEAFSVFFSNGLVIAGTMFLYTGLGRFIGRRVPWIRNAVILAAFLAVQTYFYFVVPNLDARNINLSTALILICAQCAWLMLRRSDPKDRRITRGAGLIFAGYCVASVLRIVADIADPPGNDFFNSTVYDALVLLVYMMLFIALTFGLFLMVNRRLFNDIRIDIAKRKNVEDILKLRLDLWEYAVAHTVDELMQKALDGIEDIAGSPIGFYHFVDDEKTLTLHAWSTRTLKEFCTAQGTGMHYDLDRAGVWADAVRTKKPIVHNDYAAVPNKKGMPEGHAKVIREMVVPTLREGRVVSVLGVGNKSADYGREDAELLSSIADIVWTIIDRKRTEERIQGLQARLRDMAIHDQLTGLYNRHYLDETLKREFARAARAGVPVGFVMMDIDHFKRVNDAFGHKAGDAVLRALADLLRKNSRTADIIYRYGGEEYLAVIPGEGPESALLIAEKWRKSFCAAPVSFEGGSVAVSISCGVAAYPVDGIERDEVIANADRALYQAKEAGRNKSVVWRPLRA